MSRRAAKPNADKRQVILDIVAEGGGLTVYGLKSENNDWQFQIEINEVALLDDDDEGSGINTGPWLKTWEQTLKLLNTKRYWTEIHPLEVHPEFRAQIAAAWQAQKKTMEDDSHPNHPGFSINSKWRKILGLPLNT